MSEIYEDVATLKAQMATLYPQALAENTDLNDLTTGNYYIPTIGVSATILNKPTTRQSNAFITCLPGAEGELIQIYLINTTVSSVNNKIYYRYKWTTGWSSWETGYLREEDSGWVDLPLASGVSEHNANAFPCRCRKINNRVYIEGCVKGFAEIEKVVATIPNGYRPAKSFYMQGATNGGKTDTFNVQTSGKIERVATTLPTASLSTTNYHFINMSYLID